MKTLSECVIVMSCHLGSFHSAKKKHDARGRQKRTGALREHEFGGPGDVRDKIGLFQKMKRSAAESGVHVEVRVEVDEHVEKGDAGEIYARLGRRCGRADMLVVL